VISLHAAGAEGDNDNTTAGEGENTVELVLRVHGGIARALAAKAAGNLAWTARVVLDGPYGGLHAPLRALERVHLLAGEDRRDGAHTSICCEAHSLERRHMMENHPK
jgi:hypothetical protein